MPAVSSGDLLHDGVSTANLAYRFFKRRRHIAVELENTTLDLESGLDENRSEDPPRNTLSGCYRWFHSNDRRRHIWSLRQAFFIVAGGIAVKTPYLK